MSVIEEVRRDRLDLARVLKKHTGIRKIVEELYPDSSHFIYELLQNAEDTGATEAAFILSEDRLIFEHNGRPFEAADIYAITDIGEGTKGNNEDNIGRFGIGFKAVFAYTETPRIWSPTFAFEITGMVLPAQLAADPSLHEITRFEFPFNNPKKPPSDAYQEVRVGLDEISETTLLFLAHIESIRWRIQGKPEGKVLRIAHSEHHVEVLKQSGRKTAVRSHFLHFKHPVDGLEGQHIAVAFALDVLPAVKAFDVKKPLYKQFRVVPATPGCVAVFFTAEKEASGLRFHLHAPFVPELSRASIKDTATNQPLFQQLAVLAADSLFVIRDLGLLTSDFLAVLPNPQNELPGRYQCVRRSIITAMNEQPLTPTHAKSHAPAMYLIQGKASLKALLSRTDIEFLVDWEETPTGWAIGATQKNSDVDRFLSGLDILEWDIDQFVEVLEEHLSIDAYYDLETDEDGPDPEFVRDWLSTKSEKWHQKLYALLYRELEPENNFGLLKDLCIVRLSTGEYGTGDKCFFPTDDVEQDAVLPRVDRAVYASGKSKVERSSARKLLEAIGVREVGEAEQVEAILQQRYSDEAKLPNKKIYKGDLKRFIALVEADASKATLFEKYRVFELADGKWGLPNQVYLDAPYLETGLSSYYGALGKAADRGALTSKYQEMKIPKNELVKFCQMSGVQTKIHLEEVPCDCNSSKVYLYGESRQRRTKGGIDRDWYFPHLGKVIEVENVELSRLMWRTMCDDSAEKLEAEFQWNGSSELRRAPSLVLNWLTSRKWVPQGSDVFVKPSEATRDLLPKGFPFDQSSEWLKAIHFGEEITKRTREHRKKQEVARELGFDDDESLNDARWFARLDSNDRQRVKTEYQKGERTELPDHEPGNPDRRAARVNEQAVDAPERVTERRTRSVSVGRETVKKDTDPYLRQQYLNSDGEMICQVCKAPLPFKLSDGKYYFEAVEFLPELRQRHYQNYLSLCPNHAAMFRHANDAPELMQELFLDIDGNELDVILAGEDKTIYFTKIHIIDLEAVITSDDDEDIDGESG